MWFRTNSFLRTSDPSLAMFVTLVDCVKTWSGTLIFRKEKLKEIEE